MSQIISYYSLVSYTVGTPGENYTIPFPYIFKSDVFLFVNGTDRPESDITWTSDSTVQIANTVDGDEIYLRRYTRRDQKWVEFSNAGSFGEDPLNLVTTQLLYLIQEIWDAATAGTDPNAPPGSGGDPGEGDNTLPALIDNIITELLNTQLFADLVQLIELTDINAENAIQNAINTHNNWQITQQIDAVVDAHTIELADIGVNLGAIDAQIINLESTTTSQFQTVATQITGVATRLNDAEANALQLSQAIADLDSATATSVSQLQAEIADNEALILTVEQAAVTADSALSSRVDTIEVGFQGDVANLSARIGTVESAYVNENEATAIATTQVNARFESNNWEGLFQSSDYIFGIRGTANANASNINGIESFLVGAGGSIYDPDTWQPGSQAASLAGLTTTVTAQASTINANADMRTALFAAFYPSQGNDATQMVAAMEETWQVYVDEESGLAQSLTELQLNTQPIFFRQVAPDPRAAEFENQPWHNIGFPEGSAWFKRTSDLGHQLYYWQNNNGVAAGLQFVTFPGINGAWVETQDQAITAQGITVQSLQQLYNSTGLAGATVRDTIQAVVGDDIAAISQTLEAYVDTENGLLYSAWNVRINQYNGGVPVIAGVGLGMQQDPNNPEAGSRSDFIVMADYFSVVRPPDAGTLVNGTWNSPENAFVPFIVNTGNIPGEPDVTVNGDLFVRNTLSSVDGVAGRFTFTDLDGNGYPVVRDGNFNATGSRLVLASDTNNYNLGVGGSVFPGGETDFKVLMWAGTGTMSHNNAVFYIDTDGNAFFGGKVSATNIDGAVSSVTPVNFEGAVTTVPTGNETDWFQVGNIITSNDPQVPRLRRATATVTVGLFGSQAGRARIQMSRETSIGSNVYDSWVTVSEYPIGMDIGTGLTLSGSHPVSGSGRFRLKVEIKSEPPNGGGGNRYPSSNRFNGTLILAS